MIVSTVAHTVRPAARPSRPRAHAGHPGPGPDVASLLRRALIRNELLLTIAAASPRPAGAR